ncbi:MAG: hypothetical protein SNJ67_06060 [Chloracidobacterium sp.]|uniref:Uncharacterized protein n=1 Tax=Chloracidobacterium validum TaxID=2821543 RepID=A0ABX8BCZ9_9BACT|nr:hypothetical protein [Chloracidobacterium validum]QUW04579.1 hypothetical protein J8C06_12410 [Chloracidobacterium validum]
MPTVDTDIICSRATDWFYTDLAERLWGDLPEVHRARTRLWDGPDWLRATPAPRVVVVNWVETIHDPRLSPAEVAAFMSKVNSVPERALVAAECVSVVWFERQLDGPDWTAIIDVGWQPQTPLPAVAAKYRFLHYAPTQAEQAVLAQVRAVRPETFAARPLPWAVVGALTPERAALVAALADWQPHGFAFLPPGEPFQVRADRGRLDRARLARVLRQSRFYIWTSHHAHPYFESFRVLDALLSGACPVKLDARHASRLRHLGCVLTDVEELRRTGTPTWAAERITALCDQLLAQPTLGKAFATLWWE